MQTKSNSESPARLADTCSKIKQKMLKYKTVSLKTHNTKLLCWPTFVQGAIIQTVFKRTSENLGKTTKGYDKSTSSSVIQHQLGQE